MKKLIAFLKSLFCKSQDHTEDIKPVDPETETVNDGNVVILDNVNTVIDECECDENCECCDCNEESCEEEHECTKETCEGCECCDCECTEESCDEDCECCDCNEEPCEDCEVAVICDNPEVIVKEELDRWGIPASNLNYDCILAMVNISEANSYDDITSVLAPAMDRSKASISTSLKALVAKANFANSIFHSIKDIDTTQDFKCIIFDIYTWIKSL